MIHSKRFFAVAVVAVVVVVLVLSEHAVDFISIL